MSTSTVPATSSPPRGSPPLFFDDVRVFDGESAVPRTRVLVRDGRIEAMGPALIAPPAARVVAGEGRTLLPGLVDAHVHLDEGAPAQALAFGVTTQLDMFADPSALPALRAAAAGRSDVADLRSAGTGATAPGGHPAQMVDAGLFPPFPTVGGPEEADDFVAERVREGSDYLKLFASGVPGEPGRPVLDGPTLRALVRAAHRRGLAALAHATDVDSAVRAVRCGADGLAHLPFDRVMRDDEVELLARAGVFVVPTLTMAESFCHVPGGARLAGDPRVAGRLGSRALENLRAVMEPSPASPDFAADNAARSVPLLARAGVALLVGTDALAPGTAHGASVHRELELLVAAGLSPADALAGATSRAAACFGLGDRGAIRPGLRADLLLVAGDPVRDVTRTRDIVDVYRAGVPLSARTAPRERPAPVRTG